MDDFSHNNKKMKFFRYPSFLHNKAALDWCGKKMKSGVLNWAILDDYFKIVISNF
jgi:hypothetical protein